MFVSYRYLNTTQLQRTKDHTTAPRAPKGPLLLQGFCPPGHHRLQVQEKLTGTVVQFQTSR